MSLPRSCVTLAVSVLLCVAPAAAAADLAAELVGIWTVDEHTWILAKEGADEESREGMDRMARDMADYSLTFGEDGSFGNTYRSRSVEGTFTVEGPGDEGLFQVVMAVAHLKDPEQTHTATKTVHFEDGYLVWHRNDLHLYLCRSEDGD